MRHDAWTAGKWLLPVVISGCVTKECEVNDGNSHVYYQDNIVAEWRNWYTRQT